MCLILYTLQNGNSSAQFTSERKEPFNWTKRGKCRLLSVHRLGGQVKYKARACDWAIEKEGGAKHFREGTERKRERRRMEKKMEEDEPYLRGLKESQVAMDSIGE